MRRQNISDNLRKHLCKFHFHNKFTGFQHWKRRQSRIKNIKTSNCCSHISVKCNSDSPFIHDPGFSVIIHDRTRTHHIAHTLYIKLSAQRILAFQKKFIIPSQNLLYFFTSQRCTFFKDIASMLFLSLQFYGSVTIIIDSDTIFFSHQNSSFFFLIRTVPVIIKVKTSDHISPFICMRIQMKKR